MMRASKRSDLRDIHDVLGEGSQDRSWFLLSGSRRPARIGGGLSHIRGGARRNHNADADEIIRHAVCVACHNEGVGGGTRLSWGEGRQRFEATT